jgi:hypothetical protein
MTTNTHDIFALVQSGDLQAVLACLDADAQLVHAVDTEGDTPLHAALRVNNEALIDALLKSGANPKATNAEGMTPLQLAKVLCRAGMNIPPRVFGALRMATYPALVVPVSIIMLAIPIALIWWLIHWLSSLAR